jgi:hypothetical protein
VFASPLAEKAAQGLGNLTPQQQKGVSEQLDQYALSLSRQLDPNQIKLDFNHFIKTRQDLEERVYKNGLDIYKRYPINISNNSKILEYTLLYKKSNFYNKQLIIHQKLYEDFKFNYRIINLNFNFIIVHFLKTLLIIFMLIIFFKWAYYFNTKLK